MESDTSQFFPVLPIRNTVVYPGLGFPLRVGRPKSVAAVLKAQQEDSWILTVAVRRDDEAKEATPADLYRTGTLAKIEKVRGSKESGYQVLVRGMMRFRIEDWREKDGYLAARGSVWKDVPDVEENVSEALLKSLKSTGQEILALLPADTRQLSELLDSIDDLTFLSYLCAGNLEVAVPKKQELLEQESLKARVLLLLELMQKQKEELQVQSEIRDKLSTRMGKLQREAFLRQQLNAIREELGEGDEKSLSDQYRQKIEEAAMPEEAKKVALEELKRLESMGTSSPEAHVIRTYLDTLTSMPWAKSAPETFDIDEARRILEADHYGLEKIKKRILQHLSVMKLKPNGRSPILLFVGPPGVGKTSLGSSIARALSRKFARASLGGVRDDAEIRGHRRTYIGAMPGRIIQGVKRAGQNNPVFILDEIDKLARSFHGDPAGALLEVLDPEQNANFLDHYLDVPFDLSKVFFIATANTIESIPAPLLDRMEVVELSGYTTAEKLHIAKRHLVPKELAEHGLSPEKLAISDEALMRVITHYTREAGVRDLKRHIAAICRGCGEHVLKAAPEELPIRVEVTSLEELLGAERFVHEVAGRLAAPGVVTGLAWTPMGGEILFVEAGLMPGRGKLILTGQLGEVMKESAQIALSLVRANLPELVPGFEYDKKDLHIHVPAGAIPKDGPSAGVAMVTTIASLFSGRAVNPRLAMTGEITLRGAVTPVGGIKEKVIAAHRAGIERILLPRRNEKDLKEVPEEVRSQLKFEWVDTFADVLRVALGIELSKTDRPWTDRPAPAPATA